MRITTLQELAIAQQAVKEFTELLERKGLRLTWNSSNELLPFKEYSSEYLHSLISQSLPE